MSRTRLFLRLRRGTQLNKSTQTIDQPSSPSPPVPSITGLSRFRECLRTSYTLALPDQPGQPGLRHVIIDGSNVAMAHGLNKIFSCRGIALAVELFWRRGHRDITVFVPNWKKKSNPLTTEQHLLKQLNELRLLSFTPSREVCGEKISSHDDRFLLHLAEKTDGIIVTNDNMREFVGISDTWRRIIQERLLPFTFADNYFMIPDDPLGRNGPHLEEFLHKDTRRLPMTPPPLRPPDLRPSSHQQQPVFTPGLHSNHRWVSIPPLPHALLSHPNAHRSHSGHPEWHPPRRPY